MYATVRRYEGIDKVRSEEITRKVGDSLLPSLRELAGFGGYYLIDAGDGVLTSVGLFETSAQAHETHSRTRRRSQPARCSPARPAARWPRTGLPRSRSAPQTPAPKESSSREVFHESAAAW